MLCNLLGKAHVLELLHANVSFQGIYVEAKKNTKLKQLREAIARMSWGDNEKVTLRPRVEGQ